MAMKNEIEFSVIICTRNRFDYLKECVASIFKQSYKPKEIIIVDDNSKDKFDIEDLLKSIRIVPKDIRITITRNKKRSGIAVSRNAGIILAKGDVLAFLDDDGYAHVNWLKNLLKHYENEDVAGAGGPVIEIGRSMKTPNKPIKRLAYISKKGDIVTKYRIKKLSDAKFLPKDDVKFLQGGNMSFRRNVLLEVRGFDGDFKGTAYREETDLCLRVARKGSLVFEPTAITYHNTAMIGGSREIENFELRNFLYWYFKNTAILFFKHFNVIDASKKVFNRTKKQINLIRGGKTGLTREYFFITSKIDAIYSIVKGAIIGTIQGFLAKHKRTLDKLYFPEPEKVMEYGFTTKNRLKKMIRMKMLKRTGKE